MMNLYLISQTENEGYDTYDSAVVCAEMEEKARMIHPDGKGKWDGAAECRKRWQYTWCDAEHVKVELIGKAASVSLCVVICTSFNAGSALPPSRTFGTA